MPAIDSFANFGLNLSTPITQAEPVTPADGSDLIHVTRAIYVGGSGNLRIALVGGQTITLTGVTGGAVYPLRVKRVLATGTTATGLVGLH